MTDWIFENFSLNGIVGFLIFYLILDFYGRWRANEIGEKMRIEIEDRVYVLEREVKRLEGECKTINMQLSQLEDDLISDDVKIKRLVRTGVPEDVAVGIIVTDKRSAHHYDD
ncbi:hypothetical protein [Vibrio fluvialis]|uniref:hypothetical protein n=1 Tax=Vibrio fluvialis TaxID=676 RepID=UPI00192B4C87|nr:hypothetical protein [Vibrio fluvialis]MBL4288374.1 hypothetical protein [Vibrio fluvialis]MBL4292745.1 hypothetical protein [Vibrio fluvialis]